MGAHSDEGEAYSRVSRGPRFGSHIPPPRLSPMTRSRTALNGNARPAGTEGSEPADSPGDIPVLACERP